MGSIVVQIDVLTVFRRKNISWKHNCMIYVWFRVWIVIKSSDKIIVLFKSLGLMALGLSYIDSWWFLWMIDKSVVSSSIILKIRINVWLLVKKYSIWETNTVPRHKITASFKCEWESILWSSSLSYSNMIFYIKGLPCFLFIILLLRPMIFY